MKLRVWSGEMYSVHHSVVSDSLRSLWTVAHHASLSMELLNLCVMVITVHWANFSWIAFFINSSVLESKKISLVSKDRKSRLKT